MTGCLAPIPAEKPWRAPGTGLDSYRQWRQWRQRILGAGLESAFSLGFRLIEPPAENEEGTAGVWREGRPDRDRFGGWMAKPEPQALLNATIFFDLRPLYGQDELVDELQQWLLPLPAQHPRFLRALAEQALGCTPSLGWFGKFVYDGGHRYPHTIDLKVRGVRPFVDSARIYALRHGVGLTNTMERLRAVGPLDQRAPSDTVAPTGMSRAR